MDCTECNTQECMDCSDCSSCEGCLECGEIGSVCETECEAIEDICTDCSCYVIAAVGCLYPDNSHYDSFAIGARIFQIYLFVVLAWARGAFALILAVKLLYYTIR